MSEPIEDEHCATCSCAGTVCNRKPWCRRPWGHGGECNIIRDERFR